MPDELDALLEETFGPGGEAPGPFEGDVQAPERAE